MKSRTVLALAFAFLSLACASMLLAQEPVKPLSQAELGRLPSLGAGGTSRLPAAAVEGSGAETVKPPKSKTPGQMGPAGQTEISSEELTFDQKTHTGIFKINVHVKNPDFTLTSDKLTAIMKAQKGATPSLGSVKASPPVLSTENGSTQLKASGSKPASASGQKDNGGGLERAIAEGNVVITRESLESDGTVSRNVGRGRKAVYEAATGDLVLTGRPEADQGINTIVATSEETVMTMNRNGKFDVRGPHKMTIRDNVSPEGANGR